MSPSLPVSPEGAGPAWLGRLLAGGIVGGVVAFGLLALMQYLVTAPSAELIAARDTPAIDFIRVRQEPRLETRERVKPPEPEIEEPAPPTPQPVSPKLPTPHMDHSMGIKSLNLPMAVADAPFLGSALAPAGESRDVMALSRTPPLYPIAAKRRGIEGWVELEFTVTAGGVVKDVAVTAAEPPGVFDQAAISAIYRWKFKPRMQSGQPVQARVSQRLSFDLQR